MPAASRAHRFWEDSRCSGTMKRHHSGADGYDSGGCHPFGGTQPCGLGGHPVGGLKRIFRDIKEPPPLSTVQDGSRRLLFGDRSNSLVRYTRPGQRPWRSAGACVAAEIVGTPWTCLSRYLPTAWIAAPATANNDNGMHEPRIERQATALSG